MTWVTRYVDEDTRAIWAVVHSPQPDGIFCLYGHLWLGEHGHMLDPNGEPNGVICSWEDD